MTDLRKAAEMALEALEDVFDLENKDVEAIQALRQALAQTEQEPVAWMHNFIQGNVIAHKPADIGLHPDRWTPLYTAPPKREWVGLTDEEVNDCIKSPNRNLFARDGTTSQRIARAIEAKLKEKNT